MAPFKKINAKNRLKRQKRDIKRPRLSPIKK